MSYGIYTGGDRAFFPGLVASVNALRWYGCQAPIAILDFGLEPWMSAYLDGFPEVKVFDLRPLGEVIRYTDVRSDDSPVFLDYGFKAFGIAHFNLFERFTFLDADLLPLCDPEPFLDPLIERGAIVSAEDGLNEWGAWHAEAIGVEPGVYLNLNAGFFSLSWRYHSLVIHEWCHLMTRRRVMDNLFADQGALNVILDKYQIPKLALERELWSQTGLNEAMTVQNAVERSGDEFIHGPTGQRIGGWHTAGCHKLWVQSGDRFGEGDPGETERLRRESAGTSPREIVEAFSHFLHLDHFHAPVNVACAEAGSISARPFITAEWPSQPSR